ncbi:MAG: class I SAM-dependent methyltransferase, partial [Candidatus Geothermarchaeales archaeon]
SYFGLREALLWSTALDLWHRYTSALDVIEEGILKGASILEVGPGWFGVELFLPPEVMASGLLVQTDILHRPMRHRVSREVRFLASGTTLPFRDGSFDLVLAMDVLEHIPRESRPAFCNELKRVARTAVLAHMPIQSKDGTFQGAVCDRTFQEWYQQRFGRKEKNTEEHLRNGHPTPEELEVYFPGSFLIGTQPVQDWLRYSFQGKRPLYGAVNGLVMYLHGLSSGPPFYSGLIVWRRRD